MHILALGHDTFVKPLKKLGHEVTSCGSWPEADLPLPDEDPAWLTISSLLDDKGLTIDAVLVTDNVGRRCLPVGLAACPHPTAFYGVDSPFNRFWQRDYARLFDLAFLDQKDQAEDLAAIHPAASWLPVAVELERYAGDPPRQKTPGLCFVGVVNPAVRPKRSAILNRAASLAPLVALGGRGQAWVSTEEAARLYRSHAAVLNENLFSGVTTRPLEIMAAGGLALSEAAPGHMDVLFEDLKHLVFFGPDNLAVRLRWVLAGGGQTAAIARAGRQEVAEKHTFLQRAQTMAQALEQASQTRQRGLDALLLEGTALFRAGRRWPAKGGARRALRGLGRLRSSAANGAGPLPAAREAGLAELAAGRKPDALRLLGRAAQSGSPTDRLALALAAFDSGHIQLARETLRPLLPGLPGLAAGPGPASFHLACAELLASQGRDLEPGFSLWQEPLAAWSALEHLQQATGHNPEEPAAWEALGDLLARREQHNQAHACYQRAVELAPAPALRQKVELSAWKGYLS